MPKWFEIRWGFNNPWILLGINKINKKCHHCNTKITPKWRRDKYTYNVLCNACGLKINKK